MLGKLLYYFSVSFKWDRLSIADMVVENKAKSELLQGFSILGKKGIAKGG